jgi:hypothetical protein
MVIRNSNSLNNISYNNKAKVSTGHGGGAVSSNIGVVPNSSKSVLSSFRNGPVKVLNSAASSGHIGQRNGGGQMQMGMGSHGNQMSHVQKIPGQGSSYQHNNRAGGI